MKNIEIEKNMSKEDRKALEHLKSVIKEIPLKNLLKIYKSALKELKECKYYDSQVNLPFMMALHNQDCVKAYDIYCNLLKKQINEIRNC